MPQPWISKKEKTKMRNRRRKKEKLGGREEVSTKKRKRDVDATSNEVPTSENLEPIQKDTNHDVTIPSTATNKEKGKLRKEARRKSRKEGRDENLLKFVDENGDEYIEEISKKEETGGKTESNINDESMHTNEFPPKKKKSKRVFPNINQLLAEAEVAKKVEEEEKKRKKYEDSISEEEKAKYVALDCEMVGIGAGGKQSALARVSVTDWNDNVIIDTFVQVPDRVTDFRTWVSGVRAKDIKMTNRNAMELNACRRKVGEILKNKILVGHSLKNDFAALMLDHPKSEIRDTAKYKPLMRATGKGGGKLRPRKLRDLVKEYIGLEIQKEGEAHTSVEDSQATMRLYKAVRDKWEKECAKAAAEKSGRKRRR
mmetsp:Transcript_20054/g.29490  ORF Transcript_20054/g.29490 Transcript_20054/m.29490 type:complete len:370 (+) Transcript_20054:77-1186(+)